MESFSLNPPMNVAEEGKRFLAVTSFERTNSVFIVTNKNNSFSVTITGRWQTKTAEKTIKKLNILLGLRSIEPHVKEIQKEEIR